MTTLNKLIVKVRLKVRDTDMVTYSPYEVLLAINESINELKKTVTQYYRVLSFIVPDVLELTPSDETGFPTDFDDLIIEYALQELLPGDYMAKEQIKSYWKTKVISMASKFNSSNCLIQAAFSISCNEDDCASDE